MSPVIQEDVQYPRHSCAGSNVLMALDHVWPSITIKWPRLNESIDKLLPTLPRGSKKSAFTKCG
jgi:hypothetical protein